VKNKLIVVLKKPCYCYFLFLVELFFKTLHSGTLEDKHIGTKGGFAISNHNMIWGEK
jgi:hypothetical protein